MGEVNVKLLLICCIDLENTMIGARIPNLPFCKPSYRYFCAKIRYHGNKGQSEVNFNTTIRFRDLYFLKRDGYFGDQKSFWTSLLRAPLQNQKSLARRINNLFPVSSKKYTVTYRHFIKLVPEYGENWTKMSFLDVKY